MGWGIMNINTNTNTNNVNPADEIWAMFKESARRQEEADRRADRRQEEIERSFKETDQQMKESWRRMDESWRRIEKNLGGLGNSLGRLVESMFSAKLCDKLNEFGYMFNTQANHKKYYENKRVLAEADSILENGQYAMIVEVKTELSADSIDEHLERIAIIRRYMDEHGDNRKLVGAVAGGIIPENALKYAQKKGLFVLAQNGDSVEIAAMPDGFKAHEW